MHASVQTVDVGGLVSAREIAARVCNAVNAAPTSGSAASAAAEGDECVVRFAGQLPHSGEWLVVEVSAVEAEGAAAAKWKVDVRCDDALRTHSFLDAIATCIAEA